MCGRAGDWLAAPPDQQTVEEHCHQTRSQGLSSPERKALGASGHVTPTFWVLENITNMHMKTKSGQLYFRLNKNKINLPRPFYLLSPRMLVPRDQTQPGSFPREGRAWERDCIDELAILEMKRSGSF